MHDPVWLEDPYSSTPEPCGWVRADGARCQMDRTPTGYEDQLRYLCRCKELHPWQCDALNHDSNEEDDRHTRHEAEMDRRALEHARYLDDHGIGL
jgi:hypothetical protein